MAEQVAFDQDRRDVARDVVAHARIAQQRVPERDQGVGPIAQEGRVIDARGLAGAVDEDMIPR